MAFFPGQPGFAGTRKVNHSGFYWSMRWPGGSGISWTICKSFAPCSRNLTTTVPHYSVFTGRMPFLPPNQQCQSTEGLWRHSNSSFKFSVFCHCLHCQSQCCKRFQHYCDVHVCIVFTRSFEPCISIGSRFRACWVWQMAPRQSVGTRRDGQTQVSLFI